MASVREIPEAWRNRPIRELGLSISGSRLEPIAREFLREVEEVGLGRVAPRLYLSTEWGVPEGTRVIAIPLYLVDSDLAAIHAERTGHVEGRTPSEILRYLRHEMGHVVNYSYLLHTRPEWEALFGPMSLPYRDDYRPVPFSCDFVRHLPGWYAQKHPDEDWSETFAVWMTPGLDWRSEYASCPLALRKLEFCDQIVSEIRHETPLVSSTALDEDVSEIGYSLEDYFDSLEDPGSHEHVGLDSALRAIFEDAGIAEGGIPDTIPRKPASALIERISGDIATEVYRWTGHFPERVQPLLAQLARRAEAIGQVYPETEETARIVSLTALASALASNFVRTGKYLT